LAASFATSAANFLQVPSRASMCTASSSIGSVRASRRGGSAAWQRKLRSRAEAGHDSSDRLSQAPTSIGRADSASCKA
jgi:hypothetical protein